jgi:hypothetical protein
VAAAAWLASAAKAFEVEGFRAGMSPSEAVAVAASRGTKLRLTDSAAPGLAIYETDGVDPILLGFCRERLFDFSRSRGTAAATFIELVHKATLSFGPAHLNTRIQITSHGQLRTVAVTWPQGGWTYAVELHVRDGASQVVEVWDAREVVCQ